MLLEVPNPKDPQDAEVACMLMQQPEQFARVAQDWSMRYAGAPKQVLNLGQYKNKDAPRADDTHR
jgi:ubiquitin-conjugating enzyme (huntingtin interacting protein 2)